MPTHTACNCIKTHVNSYSKVVNPSARRETYEAPALQNRRRGVPKMSRPIPIELSRDEAEMLVDLCEASQDRRLWWLAEELRSQWGMKPPSDPPEKPDLSYMGINNK
jgi:hypothetical protein